MSENDYVVRASQSGYAVVDCDGMVVADGLTNEAAWRWVDNNTDKGRKDDEKYRRIGEAYGDY